MRIGALAGKFEFVDCWQLHVNMTGSAEDTVETCGIRCASGFRNMS